jgi:hypothetical protein
MIERIQAMARSGSVATIVACALSIGTLTACGGGGANVPAGTVPESAADTRSIDRHIAGCPPATPGTIAQSNCREILLKVVGGRMLTESDAFSRPPDDGHAIFFAADGTFLYAEQRRHRIRRDAAMELDVLTVPVVTDIKRYQWALYHQLPSPRHGPFVNRLQGVQEIGVTFIVPGTVPSFFVSDGAGSGGTVSNTHGFNDPVSPPFEPTSPSPLTLLTFSTQTTESVCGQCWEVLWH